MLAPEEFADQGPFDVILELVGAPNLNGNMQVAGDRRADRRDRNRRRRHRRRSTCGLLMSRRARIHGSMLRPRPLEEKALTARAVERSVLPLLAGGAITVPIAATYPLTGAVEAYDRFSAGGKLGNIVLTT